MADLESRLLNEFQRGFPLVPRPYRAIADSLGVTESKVLQTLARLHVEGKVSRVGAVFRPRTVGTGTLAAMSVEEAQTERIAHLVSAHPQVNHNYEREHRLNLWFVVTAADAEQVTQVLRAIERESGCKVLSLPLVEDYHIDLGFDLASGRLADRSATILPPSEKIALSSDERALIAAFQDGLALVSRPYAELGARARVSEDTAIAKLARWVSCGVITRLGVIVRHHELGYRANAMAVWDVPDAQVAALGQQIAAMDFVTLCYRRARSLPQWPYNLYCMIHGSSRSRVREQLQLLSNTCALGAYPGEVLFSRRRFKQRGARYATEREVMNG